MNLKDQRAAQTRQRFIDAAYELFQEQGYGATSMNQIAQRAGGSRANLYLHFRNKPDIMLAKMREIEPEIRRPLSSIFEIDSPDVDSVLEWLGQMRTMWREHAVDFASMEQAMSEDHEVAEEWLGMMRRLSSSIPALHGDDARRIQFIVSLMSMDRNFYFLYVRGQLENEDAVHRAVARQWLLLFS